VQKRLIDPSELKIGDSLPCDAYDAKGKLLLRQGHVITSANQIEKLKRHALWEGSTPTHQESPAPELEHTPTSLSLILAARRQLQLLSTAPADEDVSKPLLQVAASVHRACKANADVALASILMHREGSYAIRHSVNAAIACQVAGAAMAFTSAEVTTAVVAALTMNFGMLDLQQRLQTAGVLSDEQRREVSDHCELGVAWLQQRGVSNERWLEIVRDHHERPDGSGYPARKSRDAIHPLTQLVSLADIYCARVSSRACRSAMLPNVALRRLFLNEGAAVNEHHAALFIKTLGIYPPGTGVRLHNGSIAVVTRRGATDRTPRVSSITTQDGLRIGAPIRRHGDPTAHAVTEVVDLDALEMNVSMESLWGSDAAL
jgi:HD-GYP domain-containing protein (c-di-GMP phosphodiesterase class II)